MPAHVRAFFSSLFQVLLLTGAMIALVFVGIGPDPTHYFAGSRIQLALLKNIPSPRIILVGGSNVSFGMDAELMQRTLGIPVINDGLHAGLGVAPLRELQDYIRTGDVIIISLEYPMFSSRQSRKGDRTMLSDWIEYSPGRVRYLSDAWREAPALYSVMLQRKVNRSVNTFLFGGSLDEERDVFIGTKYNSNGDFIGHLDQESTPPRKITFEPYPVSVIQADMFIFLEEFHQTALEKGAQVYFEAPASRESNCETTGATSLAIFFKTFEERSSIPLLTPLEEVCLPDQYFFDTAYHLNAKGRQVKTERLIENWRKLTASSN